MNFGYEEADVEMQLLSKFQVNWRSLNPSVHRIFFRIKEIEIELVFYYRRVLETIKQIVKVNLYSLVSMYIDCI